MMSNMNDYQGRLSEHARTVVRGMLAEGKSVRSIAKDLDQPYGQVRGYVEWLNRLERQVATDLLDPPHSPAMLVIDIENTPNLGWTWDLWNTNVIDVEQYWYMLSFAYAWYDLRTDTIGPVEFVSIFQDPDFVPEAPNDKWVIDRMYQLLDRADIVIGQNSKAFDVKKFNSRAVIHGYGPPQPFQQVDTKTAASQIGRFTSNSLKHLARELGISLKEENRGWPLWRGCIAGDPVMWKEMEQYNKADVVATAELYTKLRPWMNGAQHPNLGLYIAGEGRVCTRCGNKEKEEGGQGFQIRGYRRTNASRFQQVRCNKCESYARVYKRDPQKTSLPETVVELRP